MQRRALGNCREAFSESEGHASDMDMDMDAPMGQSDGHSSDIDALTDGSDGGGGGSGSDFENSGTVDGGGGGSSPSNLSSASEEEKGEPKEDSLRWYKNARDQPLWKLGDQQCPATTQQAAFLMMEQKRTGRIRDKPFER